MANVFTRTNDATPKPNRNTFDLSFVNNMTMKAGVITPCFLKEVMPGDSVQIDATFGFNFQPMVFPVQTDMQANLHFFYVRNRTLWRGWQDFITKQENIDGDNVPPYILLNSENRHMFETGEIGDYLGVPTVFYGSDNETYFTSLTNKANESISSPTGYVLPLSADDVALSPFNSLFTGTNFSNKENVAETIDNALFYGLQSDKDSLSIDNMLTWKSGSSVPSSTFAMRLALAPLPPKLSRVQKPTYNQISNLLVTNEMIVGVGTDHRVIFGIYDETAQRVVAYSIIESVNNNLDELGHLNVFMDGTNANFSVPSTGAEVHQYFLFAFTNYGYETTFRVGNGSVNYTARYDARFGIPNFSRKLSDLPFVSVEANVESKIRISALPFRAVEAVYNSFYRDDRNNPLIIDGKPYYNVWVENQNGGSDTKEYKMYKRNWEADVFTTAVQSPTQGILPLVGVTATGNMTFSDENGKIYYLQAELADDGTIEGISSYSSDMPSGTLRAMVDTISTGISINDFRNVNAFQRWLEVGMRKGLRYKDNIEAHFGTAPTYSELDMPEFIGGMSRKVQMNRVVQSVDDTVNDKPLGTLGGYATVLGDGGQKVSKYFDEHGFIIGFITITPKPVYSQQLNKQLFKTELLEYYFPEFAHIPMQPILNKELAPLQCREVDGKRLDDVFGYQRAWYEYLSSVDEVHGDFRTSMRDYLIQRTFDGVPELSEEFLVVGDEEVNAVFAVDDPNVDKIFGQIYFDVKMKRPIPAIGIPKLEA